MIKARQNVREKPKGALLALPAALWLGLFFLLPLIFVLVASFMTRGQGGSPVMPWTLENYQRTFGPFGVVLWRSLGVALWTTFWCLLLGYPLAFFISTRRSGRTKQLLLFFILLPFWTNFLVRTYALQTIIGKEGFLNSALQAIGLISEPLSIIYTPFAVILGLIYGYLPFMVLPIYASVDRLDFHYVEAANDLGANDWNSFWRIIFPLTLPGVVAGCMLVFIPAIGSFVTPDLLGGTQGTMIGNLVQRQFGGRGNIPLGSAISIVMMMMVLIGVIIYLRFGDEE
ncbi:MAG: ABC transporter permease [Deinococcales bacterium]